MKIILIMFTILTMATQAWANCENGSWKVGDTCTFYIQNNGVSGSVDCSSAITYRVYEDETATPVASGTMELLDSSNTDGFYSEALLLDGAWAEKGKSYTIRGICPGTLMSVTLALQIEAEVDSNTVSDKTGYTLTQAFPTNFSSQSIDTSGRVLLQPSQPATTFTSLTVTGTTTMSDGLVVARSTANQPAISATGNGTGEGIYARGGVDGNGIEARGGNTSGIGLVAYGFNNHGMKIYTNGLNIDAFRIEADPAGSGNGIRVISSATGHGLHVSGGSTSGDGIIADVTSGAPIRGDITGNLSGSIGSLGATAKADVNAEVDTALADYDPPTRVELTTDKDSIITEVNANETKIDAVDDFVDTEIGDISARLPAALVSGRMSSDMVALSGDTVAADALESAYDGTGYCDGCIAVTVSSGAATPASPLVITETGIIAVDNQFKNYVLRCGNQERKIAKTDTDTTDTIVVEPGNPFIGALSGTCYIK